MTEAKPGPGFQGMAERKVTATYWSVVFRVVHGHTLTSLVLPDCFYCLGYYQRDLTSKLRQLSKPSKPAGLG